MILERPLCISDLQWSSSFMTMKSLPTVGAAAGLAIALGTVAAVAETGDSGGKATPAAAPEAARPKAPAAPGDFDGDGRRDLVAPDDEATVKGKLNAGLVAIAYNTPAGVDARKRQVLTMGSPGIPGAVGNDTSFGSEVASADFDRDGRADLAVLTRPAVTAASIVIVYGGAKGLTRRTVTLKAPGAIRLATGDFDGNGAPDLVAAAHTSYWTFRNPGRKAVPGTKTKLSVPKAFVEVTPVAADVNGDRRTDLVTMVEVSRGAHEPVYADSWGELRLGTPTGLSATKQIFGRKWAGTLAAAGDVTGDGKADLVVAHAGKTRPGVSVMVGTRNGLGTRLPVGKRLPQRPQSMAVGDLNGDDRADAAFGITDPKAPEATMVVVLSGSTKGLAAGRVQYVRKSTPGLPQPSADADLFGYALSIADLNGDRTKDLTVGAPQQDWPGLGRLFLLPGSRAGVTMNGGRQITSADLGLGGDRSRSIGGTLLP
jgi:hypothetical protein